MASLDYLDPVQVEEEIRLRYRASETSRWPGCFDLVALPEVENSKSWRTGTKTRCPWVMHIPNKLTDAKGCEPQTIVYLLVSGVLSLSDRPGACPRLRSVKLPLAHDFGRGFPLKSDD